MDRIITLLPPAPPKRITIGLSFSYICSPESLLSSFSPVWFIRITRYWCKCKLFCPKNKYSQLQEPKSCSCTRQSAGFTTHSFHCKIIVFIWLKIKTPAMVDTINKWVINTQLQKLQCEQLCNIGIIITTNKWAVHYRFHRNPADDIQVLWAIVGKTGQGCPFITILLVNLFEED